jgi:hypothetical protein
MSSLLATEGDHKLSQQSTNTEASQRKHDKTPRSTVALDFH